MDRDWDLTVFFALQLTPEPPEADDRQRLRDYADTSPVTTLPPPTPSAAFPARPAPQPDASTPFRGVPQQVVVGKDVVGVFTPAGLQRSSERAKRGVAVLRLNDLRRVSSIFARVDERPRRSSGAYPSVWYLRC